MTTTKILGNYGEEVAVEYLKKKGYQIVEVNFRNKLGEIDIIAKDEEVICFTEVKTRQSTQCGQPFEAVNYFKARKMSSLALSYLKYKFRTVDISARFDVISIVCNPPHPPQIYHIKNAFDLTQ